jgi:hypothetical protein
MLVLLIIFMVTAPLLTAGVPLDLPQAAGRTIESQNKEPVVVSITQEGKIYVGQEEKNNLTLEELVPRLKAIFEARLELFRLKDAKAHPGSASTIVGTGPGGAVTESDRLRARAKAMMQQRTAALTGKKTETSNEDVDAPKRLEEESLKARTERENNERMVRDVEDSVQEFARGIEESLKAGGKTAESEHEQRRWEDALGVEDEVRDFIFDLQRSSRSKRIRVEDRRGERGTSATGRTAAEPISVPTREGPSSSGARTATPPVSQSTGGGSYSSYKTPEERAAFIKQQAEQRMAERLAALGIKAPSKGGETPAQRAERERAERAAKLRQAEEEDARREAERQARLAEEQGPPVLPAAAASKSESKPPPAPPSRRSGERDAAKKDEEERITQEQEDQLRRTQQME